jgi:hypothetical protein
MKKILITLVLALLVTASLYSQDKKKEFTPGGKVWGLAFMDYYYKVSGDTTGSSTMEYSKAPKDKQAFAFRRIYLGYDYNLSERFSTEFVAEFGGKDLLPGANVNSPGAGYGTPNPDGKETFYIKIANLRWKNIFSNADLVLGQLSTPTFALLSEKIWGFRNVEKTIMDAHGNASSFDFGAALQGKFDKNGTFGYNVMIANGRGAQLENNKFKKYYGDLYGYFLDKKIVIDVYGDYEDNTTANQFVNSKRYTIKGFAALQMDKFKLGVEAFQQAVETTGTAVRPFGFSVFANANFLNDKTNNLDINAFARYDMYDPNNNNTTSGYKESFITAGVDFQIDKQIHIIPNLWMNMYSDKASPSTDRKSDVVPRITVSYRTP